VQQRSQIADVARTRGAHPLHEPHPVAFLLVGTIEVNLQIPTQLPDVEVLFKVEIVGLLPHFLDFPFQRPEERPGRDGLLAQPHPHALARVVDGEQRRLHRPRDDLDLEALGHGQPGLRGDHRVANVLGRDAGGFDDELQMSLTGGGRDLVALETKVRRTRVRVGRVEGGVRIGRHGVDDVDRKQLTGGGDRKRLRLGGGRQEADGEEGGIVDGHVFEGVERRFMY